MEFDCGLDCEENTLPSPRLGETDGEKSVISERIQGIIEKEEVVKKVSFPIGGPYYLKTMDKYLEVIEPTFKDLEGIVALHEQVAVDPEHYENYAEQGGFFHIPTIEEIKEKLKNPNYLAFVLKTFEEDGDLIAFAGCNIGPISENICPDEKMNQRLKYHIERGDRFCSDIDVIVAPAFRKFAALGILEWVFFSTLSFMGFKWALFEIYEITGVETPDGEFKKVNIPNGPSEGAHFDIFGGQLLASFPKFDREFPIETKRNKYSIDSHIGAFLLSKSLSHIASQISATVDFDSIYDPIPSRKH